MRDIEIIKRISMPTVLKESYYPYRGLTIMEQELSCSEYSYTVFKNNVASSVPSAHSFSDSTTALPCIKF